MSNCIPLRQYVDYWDEWHQLWSANVTAHPPILTPILGWPVPYYVPPIWQYFPEPYWGNPYTNRLVAVFLNINPGAGGVGQDILNPIIVDPIATYQATGTYSETVQVLSNNGNYPTTTWFQNQRAAWLNLLYGCWHTPIIPPITVDNIIAADLVPWHTPNVEGIAGYIMANIPLIDKHVLQPTAAFSHCSKLKGLVFAKGAIIETIFNVLNIAPIATYHNIANNYRIRVYLHHTAYFIVFVGGQGMRLPHPCAALYQGDGNDIRTTIAEIINHYLNLQAAI